MFKNFGIILKIDKPHVKIYDCTSANPTAHTAFQQLTQPFSSSHSLLAAYAAHTAHTAHTAYTAFQ